MNTLAPHRSPHRQTRSGVQYLVLTSDGLENSRTLSNWAELARVGKQLDVFNTALRASPERMKVKSSTLLFAIPLIYKLLTPGRHRLRSGGRFGPRSSPQARYLLVLRC